MSVSPGDVSPGATPNELDNTLSAAEFLDWLAASSASNDLVTWVRDRSLGWPEAWHVCPRGDWLLAIAVRTELSPEPLMQAVTSVARMVEDEISSPGLAPLAEELGRAADSGELAPNVIVVAERASERASDYGEGLAYRALALAARAFAEPEYAVLVPAHVAELAMVNVLDCAMMSAHRAALAATATRIRALMPVPVLARPPQP